MKKVIIIPAAVILLACAVLAGAWAAGGKPAPVNGAADVEGVQLLAATDDATADGGEAGAGAFFGKDKVKLDLPDPSKYEGMTDEERAAAMQADLKAALDQKVADGELTQEQADRMLERFSSNPGGGRGFKGGKGLLSQLGIDPSKYEGMTDDERTAAMQADVKAALDAKVASGELTQEQADKILECFTANPDGGMCFGSGRDGGLKSLLPDPSKYDGMTDEERAAAMQADLKAALDQKVTDGTMTQEQADKMLERFTANPDGGMGFRGGRDGGLKSLLPDMSKYDGMTDEERAAAMQADLKAALDQKVADGTMTQEQADQMLERFSNGPSRGPGMGGGRRGFNPGNDSQAAGGAPDVSNTRAISA